MISSTREKVFQTKQEGEFTNDQIQGNRLISSKGPSSSTTSRQWSGFRNPRIVRVSSSSGGKDRHSKVCTIRGLRDRRIRLSVPTAIQLYDLQDRLGLGQPSKVIDWLLDNTKDDIDKLPPLQIPQGFGHQYFNHHQPMLSNFPGSQLSSFAPNLLDANSMFIKDAGGGGMVEDDNQIIEAKRYWDNMDGVLMRAKSKEEADAAEKGKWIKVNDDRNHHQQQQNQDGNNHSSLLPAGLLNNGMAFDPNYNYHWEPPSLSLSQFGILPQTHENFLSNNTTNNSTSSTPTHVPLPISSHAPQLFFCPPPSTVPSFFPAFNPHYADDHSSRVQMNPSFQLLSSNSQHVLPNSLIKPFSLNVNAGLTQNDDDDDDDDADDESREDDHDQDNIDS